MRRQRIGLWLSALLGGGLVVGCRSGSESRAYPEQPLLLSKTPVEGKIEAVDTDRLAATEPTAPPAPADALATIPKPMPMAPSSFPTQTADPSPGEGPTNSEPPLATLEPPIKTTARPRAPVVATPAVRSTPREAPLPVVPSPVITPNPPEAPAGGAAGPQGVPGTYGHDANYVWLQGVVDRHYRGHTYLRYCDPTVEDRLGGKVCLEADPRLDAFKDGDVLFVEGSLSPETEVRKRTSWQQYPHYRVKSVTLIRRKD